MNIGFKKRFGRSHDYRSDHHGDGADGRLPNNPHDLHVAPVGDHSRARERDPGHDPRSGGLECIARGWVRSPQDGAHRRALHAYGVSVHHEGSQRGHCVQSRYDRILGRADADDVRDVVHCMKKTWKPRSGLVTDIRNPIAASGPTTRSKSSVPKRKLRRLSG